MSRRRKLNKNIIPSIVSSQLPIETMYLIGQALKKERILRNLKQIELAQNLGVSVDKIRRLEQRGESDLKFFIELLQYYRIYQPIEYILNAEERLFEFDTEAYKERIMKTQKRSVR